MSTYSADPQVAHAPTSRRETSAGPDSDSRPEVSGSRREGSTECIDFVRFCYRRRRVSWPALYDEMCAVAARGAFRGLGYSELAERGISFCLPDLPALAALTERVIHEDRTSLATPGAQRPASVTLSTAPARS